MQSFSFLQRVEQPDLGCNDYYSCCKAKYSHKEKKPSCFFRLYSYTQAYCRSCYGPNNKRSKCTHSSLPPTEHLVVNVRSSQNQLDIGIIANQNLFVKFFYLATGFGALNTDTKLLPDIWSGFGKPSNSKIVGATSAKVCSERIISEIKLPRSTV